MQIGQTVFYTLNDKDSRIIGTRVIMPNFNVPAAGDTYPMMVTKVNEDGTVSGSMFTNNGIIVHIGNVSLGDEPGTFKLTAPEPEPELEPDPEA